MRILKVTVFVLGREQRHQSSTHPCSVHKDRGIHLNFTTPALSQGHPKAALRRAMQSSRCLKRQCMLLGKTVPKPWIGFLSLSLWLIDPCNVLHSRRRADFCRQRPAKSCIMHRIKTAKRVSSYTAFPVNPNSLFWVCGGIINTDSQMTLLYYFSVFLSLQMTYRSDLTQSCWSPHTSMRPSGWGCLISLGC